MTNEQLEFLATVDEWHRKYFIEAMQSKGVEDDIKSIVKQLPKSLSKLKSSDLADYITRKSIFEDACDHSECDADMVVFGPYMWYLCLDEVGFYWCGGRYYDQDEHADETVTRVSPKDFDDPEKIARKMVKEFRYAGNVRDRWFKRSDGE